MVQHMVQGGPSGSAPLMYYSMHPSQPQQDLAQQARRAAESHSSPRRSVVAQNASPRRWPTWPTPRPTPRRPSRLAEAELGGSAL